ncbi:uncharacterized protein LOC125504865 [Dendroctonus ponderosae]|uniref:uncharacterized protein LOC109546914 n=1 Tax=Dendroctonus ponderosae TaxID=77166 RepID=UPI0020361574|nr:uncharacterized protein LOC109546914 [Dendroctonus ponderosae]XP_048523436.1 uncharacterized protein LOC125504865 [Dendroctonus ponderosae]KAH1014472.1 hypothetical protein HUJ05_012333 [Dendroctonus ponderosae]KAH1014490.1 hypothetical protein HUJ05_012348 [Dendroctonus ponderosae]
MFITFLLALPLISLCRSFPAPPASLDANETKEVIFVPYDVKFVPVELDDSKLEKQPLDSKTKETATSDADHKNFVSFDRSQGKFDYDQTEPSEDYILVPMSVFKALEDHAIETGSLKQHLISKRQAPADGFNVFRSITREKRRIFRPPPLVGYLNNYDRFPTVA